uniref:Uncharacterized protein n=1 Tax=Anguilla anguilla TaxID=7936 RepID=A0A0E9TCT9_ANGAN
MKLNNSTAMTNGCGWTGEWCLRVTFPVLKHNPNYDLK